MRMLCCPNLSPVNASNRLPGGDFKSSRKTAMASFSCGKQGLRFVAFKVNNHLLTIYLPLVVTELLYIGYR